MKSRLLSHGLPLLAASGLVLAACGADDGAASSGDGPSVAAAFYPLAFVAERVGGEHATVENLTQPGVESHDLELTARQVGTLADADLVLHLAGFQPGVDSAIEQNATGSVLDAASVVELLEDEHDDGHDEDGHDDAHDEDEEHDHDGAEDEDNHGHGDDEAEDDGHDEDGHDDEAHDEDEDEDAHDEDEEHDHDGAEDEDNHGLGDDEAEDDHDHGELEGDPHVWLDPTNLAAIADATADMLAEADPDNADAYRSNAAALSGELDELDDEFSAGVAQCERSLIVVSHEAFGYLVNRYGLEQLGVAGLDPDSEPSPARVADVHSTIEAEGITTVFYERLSSPTVVESLATDLGLETAVLDPIEGLTDETEDEDYFSLMRENLEAIRGANDCG